MPTGIDTKRVVEYKSREIITDHLTPRQQAYIDAILRDPDKPKVQCAIEAGYKEGSAPYVVENFRNHPVILARMEERRMEIAATAQFSPEKALLNILADRESAAQAKQWSAVAKFDELAAKITGAFTDRSIVNVDLTPVIEIMRERRPVVAAIDGEIVPPLAALLGGEDADTVDVAVIPGDDSGETL